MFNAIISLHICYRTDLKCHEIIDMQQFSLAAFEIRKKRYTNEDYEWFFKARKLLCKFLGCGILIAPGEKEY